jgi:hypothetical protein
MTSPIHVSTIFVSIAAFCDPHLLHTVTDACNKAKYPQRLVFGIVDQHPVNRRETLRTLPENPTIRYTHIHPIDSRGVCWARAIAFSLYQNEPYLLQIDSHMLFEPEWDMQLIAQLEALRADYVKPIVSTYPYGFEFVDGEAKVLIEISDKTTLVLRPHPDTNLTEDNATLRFRAQHVFKREPIRGCHLAGGFIFTLGRFVQEIPYDPYLYFHGEEQDLAIRAFTHGWDIFHPPHIPLFHLYKAPDTEHHSHHWHPEWERQRDFKWPTLTEAAKQRLMDLVYRHKNLGVYGLGSTRTLADFAQLSGIDYESHCFVPNWQSPNILC